MSYKHPRVLMPRGCIQVILFSIEEVRGDVYNQSKGNVHPAYQGMEHPVNFNLGVIRGVNGPHRCPVVVGLRPE